MALFLLYGNYYYSNENGAPLAVFSVGLMHTKISLFGYLQGFSLLGIHEKVPEIEVSEYMEKLS